MDQPIKLAFQEKNADMSHQPEAGFAYAASSFANALLKEHRHWWWLTHAHPWRHQLPQLTGKVAVVPLQGGHLLIPVQAPLQVRVYRCYQPWWLVSDDDFERIELAQVAYLLSSSLASESVRSHTSEAFKNRVADSIVQVYELLEWRDCRRVFLPDTRFIDSEQALLGGHPCHPCPRSKMGFSERDNQKYAPETQGQFQLHWFAVQASVIVGDSRGEPLAARLRQLLSEDPYAMTLSKSLGEAELPWPMHPWQARQLLKLDRVRELVGQGHLRSLGEAGRPWTATSSLRCIYSEQASYMLKYSMSVKLTNSLRHLLPHEVERGLQVVDIWDSQLGRELHQRYPRFDVIREPAWLALRNSDGSPLPDSITVLRDNPFHGSAARQVFMMGSLCQVPPEGERTQLGRVIAAKARSEGRSQRDAALHWFERFLEVAIEPMLMAQANEGLLFGAHQQNTLLRLENYSPAHFYFRDCQGTGFSQLGVERHAAAQALGSENGNQLQETMANRLFAYYLIVNNLFAVIAAIAGDGLLPEQRLLRTTREFLERLRQRPLRDTSCLDYLLNEEQLYFKGNLACSLNDLNENTLSDPLQLYRPQPNPLRYTGA